MIAGLSFASLIVDCLTVDRNGVKPLVASDFDDNVQRREHSIPSPEGNLPCEDSAWDEVAAPAAVGDADPKESPRDTSNDLLLVTWLG